MTSNSATLLSRCLTGLQTLGLLMLLSGSVLAVEDIVSFSDESLRPRYQQLLEELRCPKCQNQNLADSNSPISQDLRSEVHRLLEEGASNPEIKAYLKSRYSEFILYKPEVNRATWFLWSSPVVLLLIGLLIAVYMARRDTRSAAQASAAAGQSAGDRQRLAALLRNEQVDNEQSNNELSDYVGDVQSESQKKDREQ